MSCAQKSPEGCPCAPPIENKRNAAFYFFMILLGVLLLVSFNSLKGFEEDALQSKDLGLILILGFLTGLHCIGMCGGFMMSYMRYGKQNSLPEWQMHGQYALSKVFSYAFFGAVFGFLGSLVQFSSDVKSLVSFLGGFFLLYLGARGLGLLRKLPSFPMFSKLGMNSSFSSPWRIGLLKGLMIACAPLQALYLIAASLGSPFYGAVMLAVFGLGTLPIFLFYGVFVGSLNNIRKKWADITTAAILVVFGVMMISRGMALGGHNFNDIRFNQTVEATYIENLNKDAQVIQMEANRKGWSTSELTYQYGQKIRWKIHVKEITMCNKTIEIPKLGIKKDLKEGLNIIEFDPKEHQQLVYTCWMGMMNGKFVSKPIEKE